MNKLLELLSTLHLVIYTPFMSVLLPGFVIDFFSFFHIKFIEVTADEEQLVNKLNFFYIFQQWNKSGKNPVSQMSVIFEAYPFLYYVVIGIVCALIIGILIAAIFIEKARNKIKGFKKTLRYSFFIIAYKNAFLLLCLAAYLNFFSTITKILT